MYMEHHVLFGKNFKKSQLNINTHTEARDKKGRIVKGRLVKQRIPY